MADDRRHLHSWLGSGISISTEHQISDGVLLRPIKIESDANNLWRRSSSQFEYGLLCSIAPTITFELETAADSAESAAAACWNNQYALIFLSAIIDTFVLHSIQVRGGYKDDKDQWLAVSYAHCIPAISSEQRPVSADELSIWTDLLPSFIRLIKQDRFRFAASVARTLYVHPNVNIQVASIFSAIEALLDFDQELRFRISLAISKLLDQTAEDRQKRFKKMKELYDERSKCVHGGALHREQAISCRDDSLSILRQLIVLMVRKGELLSRTQLDDLLVS